MSQNGNQNPCTNGGDNENGDELNALKLEMIALKAKVEQLIEEKQIQAQEMVEKDEKLKKLAEIIQAYQQKFGGLEDQTPLPLREMKVQLPLENWHDMLALVPRNQLGQIVPQIGDRRFARIVQPFLHNVGEHTIGKMTIIAPRAGVPSDRPMVRVSGIGITCMPDWPMPGNIKNFVEMDLEDVDLDEDVLNFFEKFHKKSLFANVNLKFGYNLSGHNLLQSMPKFLPFISSINSLDVHKIDLFKMVYKDNNNNENNDNNNDGKNCSHEYQLVLKQMMAKTRILSIDWDEDICGCLWDAKTDWCCQWLYSPREDGKPRMLISCFSFKESAHHSALILRILKDFVKADNPIGFFILINIDQPKERKDKNNVPHRSVKNDKTNEQLVVKGIKPNDGCQMMISRHPLGAAKEWIEANEKEICEWNPWKVDRRIILDEEYKCP